VSPIQQVKANHPKIKTDSNYADNTIECWN
jgi:hypothetical protein